MSTFAANASCLTSTQPCIKNPPALVNLPPTQHDKYGGMSSFDAFYPVKSASDLQSTNSLFPTSTNDVDAAADEDDSLFSPPPPLKTFRELDLSSADASGEEVDEDCTIVSSYTPRNGGIFFTATSATDDTSLIPPTGIPPDAHKVPRKNKRQVLEIIIPPFPPGVKRTDYKYLNFYKKTSRIRQPTKRALALKESTSMVDVLNSAFVANERENKRVSCKHPPRKKRRMAQIADDLEQCFVERQYFYDGERTVLFIGSESQPHPEIVASNLRHLCAKGYNSLVSNPDQYLRSRNPTIYAPDARWYAHEREITLSPILYPSGSGWDGVSRISGHGAVMTGDVKKSRKKSGSSTCIPKSCPPSNNDIDRRGWSSEASDHSFLNGRPDFTTRLSPPINSLVTKETSTLKDEQLAFSISSIDLLSQSSLPILEDKFEYMATETEIAGYNGTIDPSVLQPRYSPELFAGLFSSEPSVSESGHGYQPTFDVVDDIVQEYNEGISSEIIQDLSFAKAEIFDSPSSKSGSSLTSWDDDGNSSDHEKPVVVARSLKPIPSKRSKINRIEWPKGGLHSYCHHCRSKSWYLKMMCYDCGIAYCVRCINTKYQDMITFDTDADFHCLRCLGKCRCDYCCRKRGEEYIRSRKRMVPEKPKRSPVSAPVPSRLSPLDLRDVAGPVQYWGRVYDLDGDQAGVAFVDDGEDDVIVTHPIAIQSRSRPRARKKKRAYVGDIQLSWRFGADPPTIAIPDPRQAVRDDWPIHRDTFGNIPTTRPKWYVGKKHVLFLRTVSEWFDRPLSPLTPLESEMEDADWLPVEDDQGQAPFPTADPPPLHHKLSEDDITKAISVGLASLANGN